MSQLRILSYLVPRLSQMLGWTVDPANYVEPLLKDDRIQEPYHRIFSQIDKIQHKVYQPPPFVPSGERLKRNF